MPRPKLLIPLLLFSCCVHAQKEAVDLNRLFAADTVKHVIDDATRELALKHPGFYRYHSKAQFNAFIDSIKATVTDSLTGLQALAKLKTVVNNINCLHTGISLPEKYASQLNQQANLFPLQLYFQDGKAYVVRNFSGNTAIAPGDELASINDKSIPEIIEQLLPLIPADGYNLTMKYRALYYQFPLWYRLIDCSNSFTVVTKKVSSEPVSKLPAATYAQIAQDGFLKEPVWEKQLAFRIDDKTAFLTIHTFSQSAIKKSGQSFIKFIDQAFAQIKEAGIQHLVVDLRGNTGGSDPFAAYFASYFFDQPFRYWDRIEVTEPIAKEVKGLVVKIFYRPPVQKDSMWLWQKGKTVKDFDFYEEQEPAKNNYKGKVYVLIDGFCMSSCADVAAVLSHNKKAVFIGEETGGGYQGNNSGMMPTTQLPPFNFVLTVPLQKYYNAVDPAVNVGRGTLPDHPVVYTVQEIIKAQDKELELVKQLIQAGK